MEGWVEEGKDGRVEEGKDGRVEEGKDGRVGGRGKGWKGGRGEDRGWVEDAVSFCSTLHSSTITSCHSTNRLHSAIRNYNRSPL